MHTMSSWLKYSVIVVSMAFQLVVLAGSSDASSVGMKFQVVASVSLDKSAGRLNHPSGLFFDESKQRLYVADSVNKRIVSFDSEFKYLAALSKKEIVLPASIVRNSAGVFFIVDAQRSEIISIDVKADIVEVLALTGIPEGANIFVPGRIALDKKGRLYVIDKLNKRVIVLNSKGKFLRSINMKEKSSFGFSDVKVDSKGNVYCLDTINRSVHIFDSNGNMISSFGGKNNNFFLFPVSLAIGNNGFIYVLDRHAGNIKVFDMNGSPQYSISQKGANRGELYAPSFLWMDSSNSMYVIDGDRIQVFKEVKE